MSKRISEQLKDNTTL